LETIKVASILFKSKPFNFMAVGGEMFSKIVSALAAIILAGCGPRDVVVNGTHVTDKDCWEDLYYVEAHHRNEKAISLFARGLGSLPNKPMSMVDHSLTVCGQAADQALEDYMRAEDKSTRGFTSAQKENVWKEIKNL
jgi:hypothetical protein